MRDVSNTFEVVSKIAGAQVREAGGESGKILSYNVRNYTGTPNFKVRGVHTNVTNEIFIFSNIMKEGFKSDYQIATDPKTRSGYWWKTAKIDLLPKMLMAAAFAGLLGDALKDFYEKVTEYDKTNYIIVPLGWYDTETSKYYGLNEPGNEARKAIYFRIPHDETGRFISSLFWKALSAPGKQENAVQFIGDVFAFGAGQLPNITPAITIGKNWLDFVAGKNPYDSFRGRSIIDETTFTAGGRAATEKCSNGRWARRVFPTLPPTTRRKTPRLKLR